MKIKLLLIGFLAVLTSAVRAAVITDLPDLTAVRPFTVFGNNVDLSNVTINGDVGVSKNGDFNLAAPSSVEDVFLDTGVSANLTGSYNTLFQPFDLSTAQQQVYNGSTTLAGLAADPGKTYSSWTTSQTITGNGGVNVISVGNISLNNDSITLTGGPNDIFVINVSGNISLVGTGGIIAGAGINPSQILINVYSSGASINTHVGNIIDGTVLMPYASGNLDGLFNGALYGGTPKISLLSEAVVNYVPVIPEPSTYLGGLGALAMLGLLGVNHRKNIFRIRA